MKYVQMRPAGGVTLYYGNVGQAHASPLPIKEVRLITCCTDLLLKTNKLGDFLGKLKGCCIYHCFALHPFSANLSDSMLEGSHILRIFWIFGYSYCTAWEFLLYNKGGQPFLFRVPEPLTIMYLREFHKLQLVICDAPDEIISFT